MLSSDEDRVMLCCMPVCSGLAGGSSSEWGVVGTRLGAHAGAGRLCDGQGVWPRAPSSADSSHWVRSIDEMMTTVELAIAALVLAPLVFAVVMHCWYMTTLPETRNMRPPTEKESNLYTGILGQDLVVFRDWAAWMWREIKEQVVDARRAARRINE